jgi:hypothetical protein
LSCMAKDRRPSPPIFVALSKRESGSATVAASANVLARGKLTAAPVDGAGFRDVMCSICGRHNREVHMLGAANGLIINNSRL